MIGSSKAA